METKFSLFPGKSCWHFPSLFRLGIDVLAIRIGVHEVPPFLLAAVPLFHCWAGAVRVVAAEGDSGSQSRESGSASMLGALIFLLDYGGAVWFWASTRTFGVTAVYWRPFLYLWSLLENHPSAYAEAHRQTRNGTGRGPFLE